MVTTTNDTINGIWNYYLSLEMDLDNTSRYIEPKGQENVFSFEFAKILILSCTENESVMKQLCYKLCGKELGNIGEYKGIILQEFPKIVTAEVTIPRWGQTIRPFNGWDNGKLTWWDAYRRIKHNRENNFKDATYKNVVYALSGLYILIFYLAKSNNVVFANNNNSYLHSKYSFQDFQVAAPKNLPDFELSNTESSVATNPTRFFNIVSIGTEEPDSSQTQDGDMWLRI